MYPRIISFCSAYPAYPRGSATVSSLYVGILAPELAASASWLSKRLRRKIWSRISERHQCGELWTIWGRLVATVKVHGECGSPYEAIVTSNLANEDKKIFERLFPVPVEHRTFSQTSA